MEAKIACLADFAEDSKKLSAKAFAEKHGLAFLIHHGPLERLQPRLPGGATLNTEGPSTVSEIPFNPRVDFLVFPLRRKPGSREEVIWLGQSDSNDVVIPDASVSAVHARVLTDKLGRFFIQDMNSRNGTRVEGRAVAGVGHGDPVELMIANEVTLGGLNMTFLPAAEFQNLVNRLFGG